MLATRVYRFEGVGTLLVDGRGFGRSPLSSGIHALSASASGVGGSLIANVPPPVNDGDLQDLLYPTSD